MNNPILFTDDQFNPHNSGDCHLLIHLDTRSYSYTIIDKKHNRLSVAAKRDFPESAFSYSDLNRLEILIAENELLNLDFEQVKISLQTQAFTFIPLELYSQVDLPQYSKFIGAQPDSILIDTEIHSLGLKNISAVDADIKNTLQKSFLDPLIVSQANPLIAGIYDLNKKGDSIGFFLNFNDESFEAAVINNDTLEFYNIFEIANADEFNYFLLNLLNEFNINVDRPVTVSGEIDSQSEHYIRLKKYFDKISFAKTLNNYEEAFRDFKSHVFFSLLSLDLCE